LAGSYSVQSIAPRSLPNDLGEKISQEFYERRLWNPYPYDYSSCR
jgi:hypothetical protein